MSSGSARLRLALAVLAVLLTGVLAWRADAAQPRSAVVGCGDVIDHPVVTVGGATRTEWFGIGTACRQA